MWFVRRHWLDTSRTNTEEFVLNQTVFRERDICGIADADFSDEDVHILGKALASYLIRYSGRIICVGRDARESSTRIHAALLKGLKPVGTRVLDIGVVPSPVLYYSVFNLSADAGIMITGGDETAEYNGFRVICGTSFLVGRALEDVYKVMTTGNFEPEEEGEVKQVEAVKPYIKQISSQFRFGRTVKVHLEGASSTAQPVLEQLLKKVKASIVKASEADVGVKVSAGADRVEAFDERRKKITPELLLLLFGREILTRKPGSALLYDEGFSESIFRRLLELGGKPIAISPSEPSVQTRLKQEHAELSVLGSGEIVFADRYYGFEDAVYATCRLLEIVALTETPLSVELAKLAENPIPAA